MKYLVTGAAGFIGSHLAERLLSQGHEVFGVDSLTDFYSCQAKGANVSRLYAAGLQHLALDDLTQDPISLDGYDGVFHLAGQPGVRSFGPLFPLYLDRNVLATQRLLEAAADARVRVVFASTSSVYGDQPRPLSEKSPCKPVSPYGVTKLACEHLCHAYARSFDLEVVVLRYFSVYGPRQRPDMAFARICAALRDGSQFELYGSGAQKRSFTYVADVVLATMLAMESGVGTYNVGGGEVVSLNQAIAELEEISGKTLDIVRRPAADGDVLGSPVVTTRIRKHLGWEPLTSFTDGLEAQWGFGRPG